MNLYLIEQSVHNDYDTYDSAVVAASTPDLARNTHPDGSTYDPAAVRYKQWAYLYGTWARHPDQVTVTFIGEAAANTQPGVILASFNAG